MKTIQSEGGPLIGLNRTELTRWSGVFGNEFFKGKTSADNDYNVLCGITNSMPPPKIGVVSNDGVSFFFISDPLPTLIVDAGPSHVFLAQIDTSEEGWSESELSVSDFERSIDWRQPVEFFFLGEEMILFDSAGNLRDVDIGYLCTNMERGIYTCDCARQEWDGKADMLFVRMMKTGDP